MRTKPSQPENGTQPGPRDPPARPLLRPAAPGPVPGRGYGLDSSAAHGQPCAAFWFPERRKRPYSRLDISLSSVDDGGGALEGASGTQKTWSNNRLRRRRSGAEPEPAVPDCAR